MNAFPATTISNPRLLIAESRELTSEHFNLARSHSSQLSEEQTQWRAYIHLLALYACQDWFSETLPDAQISTLKNNSTVLNYLTVEDSKVCIIAKEHILDEQLHIPRIVVDSANHLELCAHYYVWVEVLEEEQEVLIRGFLRYDELIETIEQFSQIQSSQIQSETDEDFALPLAALNDEPNHLLSYVQYVDPDAIAALSHAHTQQTAQTVERLSPEPSDSIVRMGDWLEDKVTAGWQTLEQLLNNSAQLAWATRSRTTSIQAGKFVNLGIQFSDQAVVLLVTAVSEVDEKIGVHIQVLPKGNQQSLPAQLTVALISSKEELLQEVTSREQDDFIQLRYFKGKPGIRFSIEISFGAVQVREAFEL